MGESGIISGKFQQVRGFGYDELMETVVYQ